MAPEREPPMSQSADDADQDRLILDSVTRFLGREVKPHVHALEHDDIYPEDIVEGMKALGLFGATIGGRIWRARLVGDHLCQNRRDGLDGVDVAVGHL
jgi:alkylation response protein AidB-like acyl-CoA dehydrogenase